MNVFLLGVLVPMLINPISGYDECTPYVKFKNCLAIDTNKNPLWNIESTVSSLSISLDIQPYCVNSVIDVQWLLLDKKSGRIALNTQKYRNKHVIIFPPHTLKPNEYVLLARVQERAFLKDPVTVEQACWIRVLKKNLYTSEHFSPRANNTKKYQVVVYTNTIETGWTHCTNPHMPIYVSGKNTPWHTFFGELAYFDQWIYNRTRWIVGTWSWRATYSYSIRSTSTWFSKWWTYTTCRSRSATVYCSRRMPNKTGHVGYPLIYRNSFGNTKINFPLIIKDLTPYFRIITGLRYLKIYKFVICEDRDTYALGCANRTHFNMCRNWGEQIRCRPVPRSGSFMPTSIIKFNCSFDRKGSLKHLKYGIYTKNQKEISAKGSEDLLIGEYETLQGMEVRLFISRLRHTVLPAALEYETHVPLVCTNKNACDRTYFQYQITSVLGSGTVAYKFRKLKELRDGKGTLTSLKDIIAAGKMNDIIQVAHILATEEEYLDITDLQRNNYQADLMKLLEESKTLTWSGVEMMSGLLQRFDMEGVSREPFHSLSKAANVKIATGQLFELVSAHVTPLVIQVQMEAVYFPELFRQVSQLFDSDYVKPFAFSIGQADSVPIHICNQEFYENYNDETDEDVVTDYKLITDDAVASLIDLLRSRSLTHFHMEYHIDAQEPAVWSRIFMEKANVKFVWKNISRVFHINMGDANKMEKNQSFTFHWSVLDKNMFFWSLEALRYHTPYVLLHYYYDTSAKLTGFDENPVLIVKMIGSLEVPMRADGLTVPTEGAQWIQKWMDRFIRAYRIRFTEEMKSMTFAMFLQNITLVKRIKAVIVMNVVKKPRYDDFENPSNELVIFDQNKTSHFVDIQVMDYWFIALLPFKEDVIKTRKKRNMQGDVTKNVGKNTVTMKFTFRFLKLACPVFNDTFQYDVCKVSENTTIHQLLCSCDTLGMPIGASISPLPYKVYGIVDIEIQLGLAVEYIIIIATILAILVYCLLLAFAPYRSKPMELIYFLSDNTKSNRYGYMLKVKTGDYLKSGTSARIGIQLYSESNKSQRHILNYPDPDQKLLKNGNEDHFLIATKDPLGKVNKIELWSDCSGYQPEWYCENIKIYDLQHNTRVNFAVQKRLGLSGHQRSQYFILPSKSNKVVATSPLAYLNFNFSAINCWNIFDASQDMVLPYIERLTIVLSHVLSTFALTLLLIHPIVLLYKDGIGINNKVDMLFYVKYVAIVTVIVAPLNFVFAVLFRDCKKTGRFTGTYGTYSPKVHMVIWAVLILLILLCLNYCLVCGPFIAYTVVYDWSVIVIISLLLNIFFCENLLLVIHAGLLMSILAMSSQTIKTKYDYKSIVQDVENQRLFLYRSADTYGLRPQLHALYIPLSGESLRKSRQHTKDKRMIADTFASMLNLWSFTILLALLIVFYHNTDSALLNRHLEDMFVLGAFGDIKMAIYDVISYEDIYTFLNESMMYALTPLVWYRPYAVNDPGILSDLMNKYLGSVRLRQKRVDPLDDCPMETFVEDHWKGTECIRLYDEENAMKNSTYDNALKHNNSMWWYNEDKKWNAYHGAMTDYSGDGYPIRFGKIRANGLYQIQSIYDSNWLDKYTKVFILEMVVYNAYTNLFTDIKLVFEREAQLIWQTYRIHTTQLMVITDWEHSLNMIVFMLYVIASIRMLILCIRRMVNKRWGMLTDVYAFTLLFIQVLNIQSIVLFMKKLIAVDNMLKDLKHKDRNVYFLYSHAVFLQYKLEIVIAVMLFLSNLLMLEFMKFFRITNAVVRALKMAFPSLFLLSLGVWFTIVSFGDMGQIIFGAAFEQFMVYAVGPMMCLRMISRLGRSDDWTTLRRHEGPIVAFMYVAFALISWIFRVSYIVLSYHAFHRAKVLVSDETYKYTLRNYGMEKLLQIKDKFMRKFHIKFRKKGGMNPGDDLVRPRVDKYRYRDQFVISEWSMLRQRAITLAFLRNKFQRKPGDSPTDEDMRVMKAVARSAISTRPELESVSHKMHFTGRQPFSKKTRTVLVPDARMESMAKAAKGFLKEKGMKVVSTNTDTLDAGDDPTLRAEERQRELLKSMEDVDKAVGAQQLQLMRLYIILNSTDAIIDMVANIIYGLKPNWEEPCCPRDSKHSRR